LVEHVKGQPAIIFTETDPFKLYKMLEVNKTTAPPRPGDIAPKDITVEKGVTPFAPGPVVGELQQAGIPAQIQGDKVTIPVSKTVVKEGEKIDDRLAPLLARLGIEPMEIGLELCAAYEEGFIYPEDILAVSEEETIANLQKAYLSAFNLAFNSGFPTPQTTELMIRKAFTRAKTLALEIGFISKETIGALLYKAKAQATAISALIKEPTEIEKSKEEEVTPQEGKTKRKT
jgi:large subunit ribosomal protein L10